MQWPPLPPPDEMEIVVKSLTPAAKVHVQDPNILQEGLDPSAEIDGILSKVRARRALEHRSVADKGASSDPPLLVNSVMAVTDPNNLQEGVNLLVVLPTVRTVYQLCPVVTIKLYEFGI